MPDSKNSRPVYEYQIEKSADIEQFDELNPGFQEYALNVVD
jgi:hypothetical protein